MRKILLVFLLIPFMAESQYRALSRPDIIVKQGAWYDIRAYGAIDDDGLTDVTAIQAALDSCNSQGGGMVYFPPGTYEIDTVITLTGLEKITLKGGGAATILKMKAGANQDQIMLIDSCSNITIEKMTFDNNETNQTGGEIRCIQTADTVNNLTIKDCIFEGNGRVAAAGSYGIYLIYCYDSVIENCFVDGWTRHDFLVTGYCERINIRNNNFENIESSAITVASRSRQMIVSNNFFYNIGDSTLLRGHALTANTGQTADETLWPTDVVIQGNVADQCFGDVINVEQGFRFVIANNVIRGYFVAVTDTIGDTGISCSAEQSVVMGNHVSGNGGPGVTLFNNAKYATGYNMVAIGNAIFDNGVYSGASQKNGIWLDDVQRCIVAGNIAGDGFDTQDYGVYASGTSRYNIIANNVLSLNQVRPLHITNDSSDFVILGNLEWYDDGTNLPRETRMSSFYQQGDIDAKAFGGHKIAFNFYQDNVAANQSAVQIETSGALGNAYRMPSDGSILAICIGSSENRSAGTLMAEVYINNVATGLSATISTNIDAASSSQAKDTDSFSAENAIAVKITTSADWAPTTADIYITIIVEM